MNAAAIVLRLKRYRLSLTLFVFIAAVIEWSRHLRSHVLWSDQDAEHLGGVVLLILGLGLRSWAAGMIHKGRRLATDGPYALVRHPLYLGSLLMMIGFAEIIEDRFALVAGVLVIVVTHWPAIRREEGELARRFGRAWEVYRQNTGLLLPRRPSQGVWAPWDGRQWRQNREWRVIVRTLVLLACLEWWNTWAQKL